MDAALPPFPDLAVGALARRADYRAAGILSAPAISETRKILVSVLMAVYSAERPDYLEQCLNSLYLQTRPADEVFIVKDGPLTPDLHATIERFRTRLPIRIMALPRNVGLAAALNAGFPLCRGDVIARMDSDDIAHPHRFERQILTLLDRPELDIVGCFAYEIDENSRCGRLWRRPIDHSHIMRTLWANPMIHPSVMLRKSVLQSLGGYNEALRRSEDHDLWFRAASNKATFYNLPEPLLYYRFSSASQSKQTFRAALERARVAYRGAKSCGFPPSIQLATWAPLLRSLLPRSMRLGAYRAMQLFDPRTR